MVKNMDAQAMMETIKNKEKPTKTEMRKYIRYLINVKKLDAENVYEDVPHWEKDEVDKAIKDIERENSKPTPKRYYVSLKEPLEEGSLR
jgi:hypothetical protein